MRGEDIQQSELFSYGSLEERVPEKHPLRAIRAMVDEALGEMSARFDEIYPGRWPAVDSAGATAAGAVVADAVLDSQRADVDGANGIQPVVPLVCRALGQRTGLACDGVHEKSGPIAGRGGVGAVLSR
jgi:hypothetical protein